MHKHKRDRLGKQVRQNHHEKIRQQIRESLLDRQSGISPLVSDTLEMFSELSHAQLSQHSESITQTLLSTDFGSLSDEEHMKVVTDIYYLIYEKIMPELPLRFKHNEDTYTATLVSFLSQQIDPEELIYWIPFMGEEEKSLMFLNIDGLSFSHKKWVVNQKLFQLLLQDIKWSSEAALAFRSILENSEQIGRRQIVQSIDFVHRALGNVGIVQNQQYLRQVLILIWVTLILLCQKLKEGPSRLESMILALKYEVNSNANLFLNEEILSGVIQLYTNDQCLYLLEDPCCEEVLLFVCNHKVQLVSEEEVSNSGLYFNYLFQFLYKNWMARHLKDKSYRYSARFYQILKKFEGRVETSPYFDKLWKVVQ